MTTDTFMEPSTSEAPAVGTLARSFTIVLAILTFILVIAGGLVTSTGSALSVPDWPLAFGRFFPPMVGGVLYEHGHRLIATLVGVLTLILATVLQRSTAPTVLKRAGWTGVGLVCLQGVLGGVTVLLRLPAVTSVAHACLGQIFFSWMVCLAVLANTRARITNEPSTTPRLFRLAAITSGFVLLQLLAGAIYRHTGLGLHLHFLGAFLVTVHILLLSRRLLRDFPGVPVLVYPAGGLVVLLFIQLILGWLSWRLPSVAITTAHVATGALILAASLLLTIETAQRLEAA